MTNLSPERQPSESGFRATLFAVNTQGLLVIGSVGRAVLFNRYAGDPTIGFTMRGERPLLAEYVIPFARDIDTIGGHVPDGLGATSPHKPDGYAMYNPRIAFYRDKTDLSKWEVFTNNETVELDPVIFEPVVGTTILGHSCATVRAATHLLLWPEGRDSRERDVEPRARFRSIVPKSELDLLASAPYRELKTVLDNA